MYVSMYVYVCMYVCMYVYVCVCARARARVRVYIDMYIYICYRRASLHICSLHSRTTELKCVICSQLIKSWKDDEEVPLAKLIVDPKSFG